MRWKGIKGKYEGEMCVNTVQLYKNKGTSKKSCARTRMHAGNSTDKQKCGLKKNPEMMVEQKK